METKKKMYKVLSAIEKKGGGTYWLRLGTAFTNRDDSINLYLDAMPAPSGNSYHLQIREMDAEDLRRRETSNSNHGGSSGAAVANISNAGARGGGGSSYAPDFGGIGGGPSLSRAVTVNGGSSNPDEIPF